MAVVGLMAAGACDAGVSNPGVLLTGQVTLRDESGALLQDASGVTVHYQGPEGTGDVVTDVERRFEIATLAEGAYDLTASRSGFGEVKAFDVVPGAQVDLEFGAVSSVTMVSLVATVPPTILGSLPRARD